MCPLFDSYSNLRRSIVYWQDNQCRCWQPPSSLVAKMYAACLRSPLHSHCILYHWAPALVLCSHTHNTSNAQPTSSIQLTMAEYSRATDYAWHSHYLPGQVFQLSSSPPRHLPVCSGSVLPHHFWRGLLHSLAAAAIPESGKWGDSMQKHIMSVCLCSMWPELHLTCVEGKFDCNIVFNLSLHGNPPHN